MNERIYSSWMLERINIGDCVRLRLGLSTIGRHSSSTIRILDSVHISRHHAEIEVSPDDRTVTIKDLNSANGIVVNRELFHNQTVTLRHADEIGIGIALEEMNVDDLNAPIYQLKYAPIRRARPPQPPQPPMVQDAILTQANNTAERREENKPNEALSSKDIDKENNKPKSNDDDKPKGKDDKPKVKDDDKPSGSKDIAKAVNKPKADDDDKSCCSKNVNKRETIKPTPPARPQIPIEIVELSSDDEEPNEMINKPKEPPQKEVANLPNNEVNIKKEKINTDYPDVKTPNVNQEESAKKGEPIKKTLDLNKESSINNEQNVALIDANMPSPSNAPAVNPPQTVLDKESKKSQEKDKIYEVLDDEEEKKRAEKSNEKNKSNAQTNHITANQHQEIENIVQKDQENIVSTVSNLNQDANSKKDKDFINPSQCTKDSNEKVKDPSNKTNETPQISNNVPVSTEDDLDFLNPSQRPIDEKGDSNQAKDCEKKDESSKDREEEPISHLPIISSVKKERIRSVSADIQNIFGNIDDDVIQSSLKEMNPLVYNEISGNKNPGNTLNSGDHITLTDDEEEEEVEELGTLIPITSDNNEKTTSEMAKSPNIFYTSFNDSKEDELLDGVVDNNKPITENEKAKEMSKENTSLMDNIDMEDYCNYQPQSDDEDIEELMFSQVLINDMKAELRDDVDHEQDIPLPEPPLDDNVLNPSVLDEIQIKQEPGLELHSLIPEELHNSCWTISDDEDYDEELETKVNDWSNRIFSQSFSNNSMSQVYDLNVPENEEDEEEDEDNGGDSNEEEEDNLDLLDDDIDNIADFYNSNTVEKKIIQHDSDEIDALFVDFEKTLKSLEDKVPAAEEKVEKPKENLKEIEQNGEKSEKLETNKEKSRDLGEIIKEKSPEITTKETNKEKSRELGENIKEKSPELTTKETNKEKSRDLEENIKEKSPELTANDTSSNLTDSPIIRKRSITKNKPIIESSSSSSEDEQEIVTKKKELDAKAAKETSKDVNKIEIPHRAPPQVIDAPSLPKHKGKHRGVSAEPKKPSLSSVHRSKSTGASSKLSSLIEKLQEERLSKDLKRKWLEKPSVAKKRDKEHKKRIKECRKDKLKELAEKHKSPTETANIKRKLPTEDHEHKPKKAKVKVTAHNRGAFLVENETKPPSKKPDNIHEFKIPKILDKKLQFKPSLSIQNDTTHKNNLKRSNSLDGFETFSQQLTKPDELLLKRQNSDPCKRPEQKFNATSLPQQPLPPARRSSTTETLKNTSYNQTTHIFKKPANPPPLNPICKEAIAARAHRTTNKITFASMEKNIIESEECKRKLNLLSSHPTSAVGPQSILKEKSSNKKKTVRFNDTPVVHYVERVTGANKKVITKDLMPMSTNKDRRHFVRQMYPIIDCMDKIISNILQWSNEWLIKRNAAAEAASDVIFPMPQQFSSFDHYKSIIFPLMKLEFISLLEREYNSTFNVKNFKVTLEYVTQNKDRFMLITKFHYKSKEQQDTGQYDLVLLESDRGGPKIFAHMTNSRKGTGSCNTIVYEIIAKNFTKEYFKAIREFNVRPVVDKVRVNFGSLDAVYQLQATPLFQKIMDPLELLKCKPPPKKKINYRGCDPLNDKQKQVLLNTYYKIIDETTPSITLLKGPPGTGKSVVIANLALQTLYGEEVRYLDKKILICAQSNAAVDVIAGKLYDISLRMRAEKRFRLIRYGMGNKIDKKVLPISLQKLVENDQFKKNLVNNKNIHVENKENLKSQILQLEAQIADLSSRNIKGTVEEDGLLEKQKQLKLMRTILNQNIRPEDERSLHTWYLSNANIICATLSSCVTLLQYVNYFDICIIDEATQCIEPYTLLPLKFGINSLVLVGDTQQLPATVLSKKANELGLGTSLFTRIQHCLDNIPCTSNKGSSVTTPSHIICSLQTQYRMHPEICRWPNQYFYRNELINGKITMEYKTPLAPFSILNLAYTQNPTQINGQITNNLEAEFVAKLLKALDGFIPNKYNSYGVITPYAHHRTTLESSISSLGLDNIMVNTIDSYQGLEKDVIIISNARTNGIGFLSNPQRLNVALTRPKKCLILCGNFKHLETVPAWRCLLENARERKVYHEISADCVSDIQRNVIDKIRLKK